jgi:hypothetical protein
MSSEDALQVVGNILFPMSPSYTFETTDYGSQPPDTFKPEDVINMAVAVRFGQFQYNDGMEKMVKMIKEDK